MYYRKRGYYYPMIYLGSFGIVALITFFGFYYVYKTKGKEMKKDKKSILLLLGSPFVSFILCTLIYKLGPADKKLDVRSAQINVQLQATKESD